jgi:hypothetical protein
MKDIVLKDVKFHPDMSQETPCFSASVYEKGKLIAHISNNGCGGSNTYHPAKGLTYKDIHHLMDFETDCKLMDMAEKIGIAKKYQTKNFVLQKGDNLFTQPFNFKITEMKKRKDYKEWLAFKIKDFQKQGYVLLNTNL